MLTYPGSTNDGVLTYQGSFNDGVLTYRGSIDDNRRQEGPLVLDHVGGGGPRIGGAAPHHVIR